MGVVVIDLRLSILSLLVCSNSRMLTISRILVAFFDELLSGPHNCVVAIAQHGLLAQARQIYYEVITKQSTDLWL